MPLSTDGAFILDPDQSLGRGMDCARHPRVGRPLPVGGLRSLIRSRVQIPRSCDDPSRRAQPKSPTGSVRIAWAIGLTEVRATAAVVKRKVKTDELETSACLGAGSCPDGHELGGLVGTR